MGSITAAVSYDRPTVRSVRLPGLRAATLSVQFYCAMVNVSHPVLDLTKVFLPRLPPVLDPGLTPENVTDPVANMNTFFNPRSSDADRTRLHGFVNEFPCVSLNLVQQASEINDEVAIKVKFVCQLARDLPEWVRILKNDGSRSRSVSLAIFGSRMDTDCGKIQRINTTTAICRGLGDVSRIQTLHSLCTASVSSMAAPANESLASSVPLWTENEPPGCEGSDVYYGQFAANEPPRRSGSIRMLAIAGLDLGTSHVSLIVSVGHSSSEETLWTSSSTIQSRLSRGVKTTIRTVVTVGGRSQTITDLVSYNCPLVRDAVDWLRNNVPTTGSVVVYVTGTSFGEMDSTSAVRVSGSAVELTMWTSDSSVATMASAGAFNGTIVRLTTEQRLDGSLTETLSYDSPLDTDVRPTHNPSSGRSIITVAGFNLALFDTTTKVRMGGSACESSRWISATTLLCRLSSGTGSAHSMVVTIFKQSSPYSFDDIDIRLNPVKPFSFCYEAPHPLNSLSKSGYGGYGSTRGGWLLTIQGTGFGVFADVVRIVVESNIWRGAQSNGHDGVTADKLRPGRIECKIPRASLCIGCGDSSMYDARTSGHFRTYGALWTDDHHPEELDQITCLMPAGDGNTLGSVIAVANQQGENQNVFSYMRPQIESVSSNDFCSEAVCGSLASRSSFLFTSSPSEGDVTANRILYLRGDNFGMHISFHLSIHFSQ